MPVTRSSVGNAGLLAGLLLLICGNIAHAEKTDIVELVNGDRITCEIKNLKRGLLQVKTDSMGTINIEWKDITRVISKELYIVELGEGTRVEGMLADTDTEGQLVVQQNGTERQLDMANVVFLDPLKLDERRIERWDGAVSAGFDATKADNAKTLTASFNARRRAETFLLAVDGSWYSRSQDDTEDSTRANFTTSYKHFLEERWYWALLGSLERNDEQGIDLRTLAGAGYGRFLVQTNRSLWSLTGGAAVVNEQRAGSQNADTNLEALLNTEYEFFTYDTPKTTVTTSFTVFPGITDWGRFRSNLDLGVRYELVADLFVGLSFYGSYDNEPPDEGEKYDYGVVTSLGYSF